MIDIDNLEDARMLGLIKICGDDRSRYHVLASRPLESKLVKFGDVTEDYSLRVFLMPRHVPPNTDIKMRNKHRIDPEYDDVDLYPYVFYKVRGGQPSIVHPDERGYFTIEYPANKFVDSDIPRDPVYSFKISDSVFAFAEMLRIDESFVLRFLKADENGYFLFKQVRRAFLFYADIEEWAGTLLALWTMSTFVYQSFSAFPYLYLLAERGSGKSRVLKIIAHLSNTGIYLLSPRLPTIFRLGDALSPTFVLDEMEFLNKGGSREAENQEFLNVLNGGYERGAKVYRTNMEKGMSQDAFNSYCPKALATTEELSGILNSRCLRAPILRSQNQEYVNRDPMEDIPFLKSLQEDILFWAINNAAEISAHDRDAVFNRYRDRFKNAPSRVLQIMMPLLTVFDYLKQDSLASREDMEEMERHLEHIIDYQTKESKQMSIDDSSVRILLALYECVRRYERVTPWPGITNKEIRERIEQELDYEEDIKFYSSKKIGKVLAKFSVDKRNIDGKPQYFGGPGWSYHKASTFIEELLQRYSIDTVDVVEERDRIESERLKAMQSRLVK